MSSNASDELGLSLLNVPDMLAMRKLIVPAKFYIVAMKPAPIAGMPYPAGGTDWLAMKHFGFHHIICLADLQPIYSPTPLCIAHAIDLEDQLGRKRPTNPPREERCIHEAVKIALDKIRAQKGIVVHCLSGTGRTGTVIGCLLRALGCEGPDVVKYLDSLNKARGRHGWPESPWQGDLVLRFQI
jgi:hypothetical protein